MTSRVSFSKLIKPTLRKSYSWIIISGIYVLINMIYDLLNIQLNRNDITSSCDLHTRIANLCSPYECSMQLTIAFVLGACLALQYFSQLYRKNQADFFGSLPIKRKAYWGLSATCSMILFEGAAVLAVLLRTIIAIGYGGSAGLAIKMSLSTLLCCNLAFILSWLTMALATALTGNVIVALMGYLALCSYAPLMIGQLISSYASTFLRTFSEMNVNVYNYLSPMANAFMLNDYEGEYWSFKGKATLLIATFAMIAVLTIVDIILFERRALEKAGSAMAFNYSKPVIKFLIAVPMTMALGLTFIQLTTMSYPWFFVGLVLGAFLTNGIIESIYRFDIRGMISSRLQLIGILCISVAISMVFILDLTGFNTRVPEASSVKNISFTCYSENDPLFTGDIMYDDNVAKSASHVITDDKEKKAALEFIQYLSDNSLDKDTSDTSHHNILVDFKLSNGKRMVRNYDVADNSKYSKAFAKMYNRPGFKETLYDVYSLSENTLKRVNFNDSVNTISPELSKKQMQELLKIYTEELKTLDYETVRNTPYVGTLEFETYSGSGYEALCNCYVYPTFEKTLSFLKKAGVDTGSVISKYKFKAFRFTNGSVSYDDYEYTEDGDRSEIESSFMEGVRISREELSKILNLEEELVPAANCKFMSKDKYDSLHFITARIGNAQTEYIDMYSLNKKALQHYID